MKKNYILLCFLLCVSNLKGQQYFTPHYVDMSKSEVIDSAYLKCKYNVTYLKDVSKPQKKYTDIQVLLVGKNASAYFSQQAIDYNYRINETLKTKNTGVIPQNKQMGTMGIQIIKKQENQSMTFIDAGNDLRENFIYEEAIPFQSWNIQDDIALVASYRCQKAVTTFRGRTYEAWFTIEIPIVNGPWKFGGLPGLILELYDSKQEYIFKCIGIEQLKSKEPILLYDLKYNLTNRDDYNKLMNRFHQNTIPFYEARGGVVFEFNEQGNTYLKEEKLPYNPIELE